MTDQYINPVDLDILRQLLEQETRNPKEQLFLFNRCSGLAVSDLSDITGQDWERVAPLFFPNIASGSYAINGAYISLVKSLLREIAANKGYQERLPGF